MKAKLVAAASNFDESRLKKISKTINLSCRDQSKLMRCAYEDAMRAVEITDGGKITDRKSRVYCILSRAMADYIDKTDSKKFPAIFLIK